MKILCSCPFHAYIIWPRRLSLICEVIWQWSCNFELGHFNHYWPNNYVINESTFVGIWKNMHWKYFECQNKAGGSPLAEVSHNANGRGWKCLEESYSKLTEDCWSSLPRCGEVDRKIIIWLNVSDARRRRYRNSTKIFFLENIFGISMHPQFPGNSCLFLDCKIFVLLYHVDEYALKTILQTAYLYITALGWSWTRDNTT